MIFRILYHMKEMFVVYKDGVDNGNQRCDTNWKDWIGFESIKLTGNMSFALLSECCGCQYLIFSNGEHEEKMFK